jgi:hypothetical protein
MFFLIHLMLLQYLFACLNSILILVHFCMLYSIIFHSVEEMHFHLFPWIFTVSFIPLLICFKITYTLGWVYQEMYVTVFILVSLNDQVTTLLLGQNTEMVMLYTRGANTFQRCRSHLKIPGTRWVAWSNFHMEDLQILGATMQNLVAQATWHPGFVHPCYMQ